MLRKDDMQWMCFDAPVYDNQGNEVADKLCPFCRVPLPPPPNLDEGIVERYERRMQANDPKAMFKLGCYYDKGLSGYPQNHEKAYEFYIIGQLNLVMQQHNNIGNRYYYGSGRGVVVDKKKANHYTELAANTMARHNLGIEEEIAGNDNRAIKHYMIAVRDGQSKSLNEIQVLYSKGFATKEDYTNALRSYQTYLDEIKSDHRDRAAAFSDIYRYH